MGSIVNMFVNSISMSSTGTSMICGMPNRDDRTGAAMAFWEVSGSDEFTDSKNWVQKGETIFGEYAGVSFGWTVDMTDDGDTVAVGTNGGAAYVKVLNWATAAVE